MVKVSGGPCRTGLDRRDRACGTHSELGPAAGAEDGEPATQLDALWTRRPAHLRTGHTGTRIDQWHQLLPRCHDRLPPCNLWATTPARRTHAEHPGPRLPSGAAVFDGRRRYSPPWHWGLHFANSGHVVLGFPYFPPVVVASAPSEVLGRATPPGRATRTPRSVAPDVTRGDSRVTDHLDRCEAAAPGAGCQNLVLCRGIPHLGPVKLCHRPSEADLMVGRQPFAEPKSMNERGPPSCRRIESRDGVAPLTITPYRRRPGDT